MIRSDIHMPPDRKMVKGRAKLIQRDPFFGAVALRLKVKALTQAQVIHSKIKSMATDSVYLIYNPEFVAILTIKQLMACIAHEAAHVALKHPLRRNGRKFKLWNYACDYAINSILVEAGYDIPEGVKYDAIYNGLSAEKIYQLLKQNDDEEEKQRQKVNGLIESGGYGDGEDGDDGEDGEDGEDRGDEDENDDFTLPDFDDEDYDEDNDELLELPEDMEDFTGGVVLDAPEESKTQESEQKIDLEIEQAAIAAKNAGKLPGGMERIITSQHVHKIDYKDLLRDWMEKNVFPANFTWKIPNRRYAGSDMNLPSMDSEMDLPKIAVCVDASGSVDDRELEIYTDEISGVLVEFQCSFTGIYFDTDIRDVQEFSVEDLPIELKITAGGGTKFKVPLDYIRDQNLEIDAILFFTDMGAWDWDEIEDPGVPVLWMNTNRRSDEMEVPFGFIIPLEIDEEKF